MSSYWIRVDPDPVTGVLISRGKSAHRHTGRRPCEDGGSYWREVATSQETPGAPGGLDETGIRVASPGAWEGAPPRQHLDIRLQSCESVSEGCGDLSQQPKEASKPQTSKVQTASQRGQETQAAQEKNGQRRISEGPEPRGGALPRVLALRGAPRKQSVHPCDGVKGRNRATGRNSPESQESFGQKKPSTRKVRNKQTTALFRNPPRSARSGLSRAPGALWGRRGFLSSPGCWMPGAHLGTLGCTFVSRPLLSSLYFTTEKVKNKQNPGTAGQPQRRPHCALI